MNTTAIVLAAICGVTSVILADPFMGLLAVTIIGINIKMLWSD